MIYLDNSATTLIKPKEVAERMIYAHMNYGNPSRGAYPASINALRAVYSCREKTAEFFGASDSSRVAFTSNITEALNICADLFVKEGDAVITTVMEHNSVIRPLYKNKADIKIIGFDETGNLDYAHMERELKKGAKSVFMTHASNLTGDMTDINRVGKLCKEYGAQFVLDTAQTAGIFKIDMEESGVDMLCFTGHKGLYGPMGIGGICVRRDIGIEPVKVGGSGTNSFSTAHPKEMPMALEAGTLNVPAVSGLEAGLDFIKNTGLTNIERHEAKLMRKLYDGIKALQEIKIYGNFETERRAPVVTFNVLGIDSGTVAEELWNRGEIAVRSGAHCAPLFHKYLGTDTQGAVRLSVSWFNTEEEIEKAIEVIAGICAEC